MLQKVRVFTATVVDPPISLAFAIYVSALFVPTMLGIFWKRATTAGAMASAISAFLSVTFLYVQKFTGNLTEWIEPVIASLIISLVAMIGVSLWTYREENATERLIDCDPG